jgi:hypothetical protein
MLCDAWETNLIYANNYMDLFRKLIRDKHNNINSNEERYDKDTTKNQYIIDIKNISKFPLPKRLLESHIDEYNIK